MVMSGVSEVSVVGMGTTRIVCMEVSVIVNRGLGMAAAWSGQGRMAVLVQMLGLGQFAILATIAFEHATCGDLAADLVVEQVENALVEAEVTAQAESDLRILALQAFDLHLDALDQHAAEQVYRNDADLHHAQPDLALYHRFGYRTLARLSHYYGLGEDGWRMEKILGEAEGAEKTVLETV